jgi:glutamyl-tRNA synthetase
MLRFEDTDRSRSDILYEKSILEDLKWLGIVPDVLSPRQSSRSERHKEVLNFLIERGAVYPCFCSSSEEFSKGGHSCRSMNPGERKSRISRKDPHCWRFEVPASPNYTYFDILRGKISVPGCAAEDFAVARGDGSATYLLACAADDHDSGVTHVIRGEEHMPNVPKQEMIYRAMGWSPPKWAHIPMILDRERRKLSKRLGAVSIDEYRESGWAPEAVVSYLATLSWAQAPTDRIAPLSELAGMFDLNSVARFAPVHDEARMRHFGRLFLSGLADETLLAYCSDGFSEFGSSGVAKSEKIAFLREVLPECATKRELAFQIRANLSLSGSETADAPEWIEDLKERFTLIPDIEWDSSNIKNIMKSFQKEKGLKGADFFHPLRIFLTGMSRGAPISLILSCIGRTDTLKRLDEYRNGRAAMPGGDNRGQ